MRLLVLCCFSFFIVTTSCKSDKVSEVIVETQEQKDAKTISKIDIDGIRFDDYGLSAESKKAVTDWQKFQELNHHTEALKTADLTFFVEDPLIVKTLMQELRAEMPKTLQTNEILARITALNTKLQKLNSLLRISNIDKTQKIQAIREYFVTMSNLNLQMNKKFEFEKNNVLKPQ
ncbi:hypothetical protein [Psychroserpens damuponensis]|uniref:hypothetical protein n=1 Tax=Psychroserpens damuponensis TaxID=943936 RepID=UPI00058AEEDD|nr:hypothetical protein [Psychroserpens damuponensis]